VPAAGPAGDGPFGAPLRVYGLEVSYFTGKLEAYLRYKGIAYERIPTTPVLWNRTLPKKTGAQQMPAVELPDGRWMTDTTPILEWLETARPEPEVIPRDPLQAFASRLLEDYADEWLWRPALHYRWSYAADAHLLSRRIADEMLGPMPLPGAAKRWLIRRRQCRRYVKGDGVTPETRAHVEGIYLRTLDALESIFRTRSFLLGGRPTLADFGFFASMFRHFSLDPTPSSLMRERAPSVFEWVARLWNARSHVQDANADLLPGLPADWSPLLDDLGSAYLPYLVANARAWQAGDRRFDVTLQGTRYERLPTSRYRVWCLERLQAHLAALPDDAAFDTRALLEKHGALAPLQAIEDPASGHDPERRAPFGAGLEAFG